MTSPPSRRKTHSVYRTNARVGKVATAVESVDRVRAILAATVIVAFAVVLLLFGIWLSLGDQGTRIRTIPPDSIAEPANEDPSRTTIRTASFRLLGNRDFPELNRNLFSAKLDSVAAIASNVLASSHPDRTDSIERQNRHHQGGLGSSIDRRTTPGLPSIIVPDAQRLKLEITAGSKREYFQLLQPMGVCLGAVHKTSNKVHLISELDRTQPAVEIANRDSAKCRALYFQNTRSRLKRWDQEKVGQLGMPFDVSSHLIVQFCPDELREQILLAEAAAVRLEGRDLKEVEQTKVVVNKAGDQYELKVRGIRFAQGSGLD